MKSEKRNYQIGFVEKHSHLGDVQRRHTKAVKVRYLLNNHVPDFLFGSSLCLEIGCATGLMTEELGRGFGYIVGLEYDFNAIHQHPIVSQNAAFVCGDGMALPYPTESVDIIVCAQVYEHVPDDEQLSSEIFRVLRPGGIVFFSGPNKSFPIELHYNLPFLQWLPQTTADAVLRFFRMGDHFYEKLRTRGELFQLFNKFEIMDVSVDVILNSDQFMQPGIFCRLAKWIPAFVWRAFLPVIPNFNWILIKPRHY